MKHKWLGALIAAGCMAGAHASIVTGTYDLTGAFNSGSGAVTPFRSNHLVMDTTYDTDTNVLSFVVTTFDLDGVSWLSRADSFLVEDLGGNGRFRATFRQETLPDGSRGTFEVFYRFVYNFNTDAPVTGGGIASILSLSSNASSFNGRASATFTPTEPPPPPPDPNGIPEPGVLVLAALALVSAAAARRGI